MTIGKRRHKESVTVLKSFIMSDKQTAKMHEAAQRQLFHMSDVQEDLHKKIQQAASRKLRASIWPQRNKGIEALDQPQIRCRHKNRNLEENAHVNHPKLVGKELIKDGSEFGHLLILANSAELLQSEGQSLREESLEKKEENDNVKIEKDFCVLGRTRLTQIRHQARLENHQRVEETHVSHAHQHKNLISIEDSDNSKNVYAEQLQGVSGHRDTEDPFFVAKRSKGTEKVSIQACLAESLKVNNEELNQHSVESNVIVHQPVHMTQELKNLTGHRSNAHQQRQVKADKRRQVRAGKWNFQSRERKCSSQQVQVHAPFNNQTAQSPSLLQLPEAPKDRHSIARQRRMLRTCERERYAAKFQWMANVQMRQMHEAHQWWLWHVMNAQNITEQQWSLYMSYLEKEQSRGDSQQRRAQKFEERASKKVHPQFTSIEPMEQSRFEEKPHGRDVSTGAAEDLVQTEIIQISRHSAMNEVCEDQNVELQHDRQVTINVEEEKSRIVEGRMRLTQLKREARLKKIHRLERENEKLRRLRNKGK